MFYNLPWIKKTLRAKNKIIFIVIFTIHAQTDAFINRLFEIASLFHVSIFFFIVTVSLTVLGSASSFPRILNQTLQFTILKKYI